VTCGAEPLLRHGEQIFRECARILLAITSRGLNAGFFSAWAKLTLHGQTDWDECRYTHRAIPIATGQRTLSAARPQLGKRRRLTRIRRAVAEAVWTAAPGAQSM
jgi:hypothetical protein